MMCVTLGFSTYHRSKVRLKNFKNHRANIHQTLSMCLQLQSSARDSETTKKAGLNHRWFQSWNWKGDRPPSILDTKTGMYSEDIEKVGVSLHVETEKQGVL